MTLSAVNKSNQTKTMTNQKHTPGKLESVGATKIWIMGRVGGAVCIVAEPECKSSIDFTEVSLSSKRWDEAMANAARLIECWNSHDALLAENARLRKALSEMVELFDCNIVERVKDKITVRLVYNKSRAALAAQGVEA